MRNVRILYSVDKMNDSRIDEFLSRLSRSGVGLSSLSGGYGDIFSGGDCIGIIEKLTSLTERAKAMKCPVVTGHIGKIESTGW